MICHICSQPTKGFAKATILGKHPTQYYQCSNCDFVQTETPYWLDEAYGSAINSSDIGMLGRNALLAQLARAILLAFFDSREMFLDYGGGYGVFVRLMRDYGFDFYLFDKFCENIFAQGFSVEDSVSSQYELITAFEVFEHLTNPIAEIGQMLQLSRSVLFSTTLIPASNPKPGEWWYYGLEHGQHVSLYTRKALIAIAEHFGLNIYSDGHVLHLLTDKTISPLAFKLLARRKFAMLIGHVLSRRRHQRSLLPEDYYKVTGKPLR